MYANVGAGMTSGPHHSLSLSSLSLSLFFTASLAVSLFASSNDLSMEAINAASFDYPHCSCRQQLHIAVQIKQFIYTHAIKLDTHRTHPRVQLKLKCIKRSYLYTHLCQIYSLHFVIILTVMHTSRLCRYVNELPGVFS